MNTWLYSPLIVSVTLGVAAALVSIGMWVGSVNSDRKSFKEFMREIREDIKRIFDRLPPAVATGGSPIQLTDLGKEISEAIDAQAWARELAVHLASEAENKDAYEIQELAQSRCSKDMDMSKHRASLCREVAYEHGLKMDQVIDVLAIELRDILLQKAEAPSPELTARPSLS